VKRTSEEEPAHSRLVRRLGVLESAGVVVGIVVGLGAAALWLPFGVAAAAAVGALSAGVVGSVVAALAVVLGGPLLHAVVATVLSSPVDLIALALGAVCGGVARRRLVRRRAG
jgi:hypothetical protein